MKKTPAHVRAYDQSKAHYIVDAVALHYNVSSIDILKKRRKAPYVTYRHIAMALIRKYTALSLLEVANMFNQRNHTITIYAVQNIASLISVYEDLRDDYMTIEDKIKYVIIKKIAA